MNRVPRPEGTATQHRRPMLQRALHRITVQLQSRRSLERTVLRQYDLIVELEEKLRAP